MVEKVEIELSDRPYTKEIVRSDGIIYHIKVYQIGEDNPSLWFLMITIPILAVVVMLALYSTRNIMDNNQLVDWFCIIAGLTFVSITVFAFAILRTRKPKRIKER